MEYYLCRMRKVLAYMFLALYLNTAMFLPVTGDHAHTAVDNINSGVEFLVQSVLGCRDATPDDAEEENNSSKYCAQASMQAYIVAAPIRFESQADDSHHKITYPPGITQQLHRVPLDILSPPPDII